MKIKIPTPISISTQGHLIIYFFSKSIWIKCISFKNTIIEKIILAWLDWRFDFNHDESLG